MVDFGLAANPSAVTACEFSFSGLIKNLAKTVRIVKDKYGDFTYY